MGTIALAVGNLVSPRRLFFAKSQIMKEQKNALSHIVVIPKYHSVDSHKDRHKNGIQGMSYEP